MSNYAQGSAICSPALIKPCWQKEKARELLEQLPSLGPGQLAEWNRRAQALIAFSGALIGEQIEKEKQAGK